MPARKCNTATLLGLFVFVLVIGYSFVTIQDAQKSIQLKAHEIVKRRDHENVLREQLKVVYNHAQRVEDELKKERERHKKTRQDFLGARIDFVRNLTNSKHEAWTRFKALDSDHKMLKAEHEETKISYTSLQAQYKRLSTDHQRIVKQSKTDFVGYKETKERESRSLQDRVQELYKKAAYYQQQIEQQEAYSIKMREHYENCTKQSAEYKEKLDGYTSQDNNKVSNPESNKHSVPPSPRPVTLKTTASTTEKSIINNKDTKKDAETGAKSLIDSNRENNAFDPDGNHRYAGKGADPDSKRAIAHSNDRYGSLDKNDAGKDESEDVKTNGDKKDSVADVSSRRGNKPIKSAGINGGEVGNVKGIDIPNNIIKSNKENNDDIGGGAMIGDLKKNKNKIKNPVKQLELPLGHGDEAKEDDPNNKDSTTSPPAGQQQHQPVKRIHQIVVPPTHPQIRENNKKMMLGNGDGERAGKLDVLLSQDKEKEGLDSKHGEAAAVVGGNQNQDESNKTGEDDSKNNNPPRRQVDVKKVTLEDDEFGDQNLDNKANAGNGGGNNNEDDDDHQGVEGGPDEGIEVP